MADLTGLGAMLVAVGGLVTAATGGVVSWRKARQEEDTSDYAYTESVIKRQDTHISRLELRAEEAAVRERILTQYVWRLQNHIAKQLPPPPPPWPKQLTSDPKDTP